MDTIKTFAAFYATHKFIVLWTAIVVIAIIMDVKIIIDGYVLLGLSLIVLSFPWLYFIVWKKYVEFVNDRNKMIGGRRCYQKN